jgi:AhpD family alkylhydroperoxidase
VRINYPQLSPEVTKALYGLSQALATKTSVDRTVTELCKIRASQMNSCAFCLDMHSKEATIHGERALRLLHLAVWRESNIFSEKERAALEWTELLTELGMHGVSDAEFEKMKAHFSEKEISDLTLEIATINTWNRLGVAFRPVPGSGDKAFGLEKAGL